MKSLVIVAGCQVFWRENSRLCCFRSPGRMPCPNYRALDCPLFEVGTPPHHNSDMAYGLDTGNNNNNNNICLLPFIFLPSTCFKMSHLMGAMLIECSETRVQAQFSGLPVADHVAIY